MAWCFTRNYLQMFIKHWRTKNDAVFVHISHEIKNQQCLGKYGCHFCFWVLRVYLPFPHDPIIIMGDIFQWVVRFLLSRCLDISVPGWTQSQNFHMKCWQLDPKIYLRTSLTSDLTVPRLLNHVKAAHHKVFYTRMKSVLIGSIWSGPLMLPLLCPCPRPAVWLLQGTAVLCFFGTGGTPAFGIWGAKKHTNASQDLD